MKSTLIALLVNALLFTALQAANPIYPSTREDLIHLGRHRKFDGVVRLAILTNSGENVDCSAAKVKSNSDFDLYLTAAHCIEESLQSVSVSVGGRLIEAITFFVHPFYMVAKQFDLGVVVFPKDTFKASNVPSYNLCAPNLEELMHSEVFSVGWGAMEGFCSYEVCPRQAMHIPVDRASEYTIENDTLMDRSGVLAQASYGDSGGPLLMKEDSGRLCIAGVVSRADNSYSAYARVQAQWMSFLGQFPVEKKIRSITKKSSSLITKRVREDFNLFIGGSWDDRVAQLKSQLETQFVNAFWDRVTANFAKARKVLKRLADGGYAQATGFYARLVLDGQGGELNLFEARRYFEKAASQGCREARHNYGVMLYNGTGGDKNLVLARELFKENVLLGDMLSVYVYALMLKDGEGGARDLPEARKWMKRAALLGNCSAIKDYIIMLKNEQDEDQNIDEIREWRGKVQQECPALSREEL